MKNISRRSFLKGGAAMGLLTAMGGASIAAAEESYTYADTIKWDAQYDVVVLGMGMAGMNAAMAAADEGASVVICEKMNEALSGGNSKVCGQFFAYGHGDYDATMTYYKALSGGRQIEQEMLDTLVGGVVGLWDKVKDKYYDGDTSGFLDVTGYGYLGNMSPEYPEMPGSEKMSLIGTKLSGGKWIYNATQDRLFGKYADKVDVWYESPAMELIQEPTTGTVIGVKVSRKGEERLVRALNGVCVCTGGFEANKDMVQQYLGVINYGALGGQYNTGDGIKMCQNAGAQLWHMNAFEGGFGLGGATWPVEIGTPCTGLSTLTQNALNTGASILVGTDGYRFLNESEVVRHGHLYENGIWENPRFAEHTWLIFDKTQKALIDEANLIPEAEKATLMEFDTIEAIAEYTGCKLEALKETIESYNSFAANGKDYAHHREAQFMRPFDGEKYYVKYMYQAILNTQGGPKRNQNAEILDANGTPIPHLYSAGEMGGMTVCMYQGGTNVAECIIFGEIAGKNAAAAKEALPAYTLAPKVESTPTTLGMDTDLGATKTYETAEGEYVGVGKGLMGDVAVRVTMADGKIAAVEVIEQNETAGIGSLAIDAIPSQFVGLSTAEEIDAIDTVSGATVTSKALKEAVKNALAQVK